MEDEQKQLLEETAREKTLTEVLRVVAHGSELRQALEKTAKSHRGALIVFDERARRIAEGGFTINSKFTGQRLAELSKMDGAIIIDSKMKKILYANTLLAPDSRIKSKETGIRHKTAERVAKQLNAVVVSVSEKSSIISVYYGDKKYILNEVADLLYRARESIENLEKQRAEIEISLKKLDSLELSSLVTLDDIAHAINKTTLFFRDCELALVYISELGKYGETLKTRYNIVSFGLREELNNIEKDYERYFNTYKIIKTIKEAKNPTIEQTMKVLNSNLKEAKEHFAPYGYRILAKILSRENIDKLLLKFKDAKEIFYADIGSLTTIIDEQKARAIKELLEGRVVVV